MLDSVAEKENAEHLTQTVRHKKADLEAALVDFRQQQKINEEKAGEKIAVTQSKLEDLINRNPAMQHLLEELKQQIARVGKHMATARVEYADLRAANLQYKHKIEFGKDRIFNLKKKSDASLRATAGLEAEIRQLNHLNSQEEKKALKLREQIQSIEASKKALDLEAQSLTKQKEDLEATKAETVTNLTPQQLANKEAQDTAKLKQLQTQAAAAREAANVAAPKRYTKEASQWSWGD